MSVARAQVIFQHKLVSNENVENHENENCVIDRRAILLI